MEKNKKPANHLVHETSPYLLQHAYNPVEWHAWNENAWEKARKENKLVLVSIGYSSCHWCHVMEHESFEDESIARVMNEHYVCIKVEREERPDVDQVYMTAVQLMTGSGGWPLNCFCLPDGRPLHGGTYFPKPHWNELLLKLSEFYRENKIQAEQYARELTEGIQQAEIVQVQKEERQFHPEDAKAFVENWKKHFDTTEGGTNRAPKFPLPNNYLFLLTYYYFSKDESVLKHVLLTLDKMAHGGIYDHLGGGFARYSTDSLWKVPHFEKMLYDNAQLVSLYSQAFLLTRNELYRKVVNETLEFISRELTSGEGTFYSALDADSEGEEGKYYVWKKEELERLLGSRFPVFADYYSVNETGYWEHGNYILLRKENDEVIAANHGISKQQLNDLISLSRKNLLAEREKRIRPGLDDKQLTSWNALMIKGYCDAYNAFGEEKFLAAAEKCALHILEFARRNEGGLFHNFKNTKATINGYLEDYSFFIESLIALYECTFNEEWLMKAHQLAAYAVQHFYDSESGLFFFTSDLDAPLITRKKEIQDTVIPSSNSSMANALFLLGIYFDETQFSETAKRMLSSVSSGMSRYASAYSNWSLLLLKSAYAFKEVVIAGKEAEQKRKALSGFFLPGKLLAGSADAGSALPLLEQRFTELKTLIYVCENGSCRLPVADVTEAIDLLN